MFNKKVYTGLTNQILVVWGENFAILEDFMERGGQFNTYSKQGKRRGFAHMTFQFRGPDNIIVPLLLVFREFCIS